MSHTPTEQRILDVLADGLLHTREELYVCLLDELSRDPHSLRQHISNLRTKLERQGYLLVNGYGGRYCLARRLASPYDGRI